jgi:hypothetical protein
MIRGAEGLPLKIELIKKLFLYSGLWSAEIE